MVDQINQDIVEQQIMTVDDVSDEEKNHIKQETELIKTRYWYKEIN